MVAMVACGPGMTCLQAVALTRGWRPGWTEVEREIDSVKMLKVCCCCWWFEAAVVVVVVVAVVVEKTIGVVEVTMIVAMVDGEMMKVVTLGEKVKLMVTVDEVMTTRMTVYGVVMSLKVNSVNLAKVRC